jgi:hypothetical protein
VLEATPASASSLLTKLDTFSNREQSFLGSSVHAALFVLSYNVWQGAWLGTRSNPVPGDDTGLGAQ